MFVPLHSVSNSGPNVRTIQPTPEQEAELEESIATQGILQALLVRPVPGLQMVNEPEAVYQVVLGGRRFKVAKKLDLMEIPVDIRPMTDAEACLAQLAENMQRQSMHPIDQWRNIAKLMIGGMECTDIGRSLGLDERGVRKMELLGRLNKRFLKLAETKMPPDAVLRVIANAPAKVQAAVAEGIPMVDAAGGIVWETIADRCRVQRIPRDRAIFDLGKSKIHWDQDLFAQPGASDEWTTQQVETFMDYQAKALDALVVKLTHDTGIVHRTAKVNRRHEIVLPRGFERVFGTDPDAPKTGQIVFHALANSGEIELVVAIDTRERAPARKAPAKQAAAEPEPEEDAEEEEDEAPATADDAEEPDDAANLLHPLTRAGQDLVVRYKNEALQSAIRSLGEFFSISDKPVPKKAMVKLITGFILALCSDNVAIYDRKGKPMEFRPLASILMGPGGNVAVDNEAQVMVVAYDALAKILVLGGPDTPDDQQSGAPAETIGNLFGAGDLLPRFDTPAFLKTVKGPALRQAALAHEMKPASSVAGLRAQLADKMPTWRPAGATFGTFNRADDA